MCGWSVGWLDGIWDLKCMAGKFWIRHPRKGVKVCEKPCWCCWEKFFTSLVTSQLLQINVVTYFSSFFYPRSVLLWSSPCQSDQGSDHRHVLWHPICLCRGERWCLHSRSEPGSGGQPQQRHRESWIPHLHQGCRLPHAPEHHRRIQIHQKYEGKYIYLFCCLLSGINSCSLFSFYLYNKGPTSTLRSRSPAISEYSTVSRGN